MDILPARKLEMYRTMLLSRRLDERAWILHRQNKISFHLSAIGHEAAQVGAGFALLHGADWVAPYPRDLALMLTLGLTPLEYFKMLMGLPGEVDSGGRQMPCNWNLPAANVISISGVAASHIPHAVGIALGMRLCRESTAVLASCGEGATSMGEWYEAVNWAAVQRLPVVFLVQNNGFALSTRQKAQMLRSPANKASGMGLPVQKVDGTDPFKVFEVVDKMLEEARAGKGPGLVEALVNRIPPHSSDDDDRSYRTRAEVEDARRQDPLHMLRSYLMREGILSREQVEAMDEDIRTEIEDALLAAERMAGPEPGGEEASVYAAVPKDLPCPQIDPGGDADFSLQESLRFTLDQEMEKDPMLLLLGMDIGKKGGVFRITEGLYEKYGPERVIDVPLSTAALVGVSIGLALYGMRPVCEIQFADFIWPAVNQIVSEAARMFYRSSAVWRVPLVIRAPYGGGIGGGLYHSQSIESFFSHVPGLKVMVCANPLYAPGLLRAALCDLNPVLFLEPKKGYRKLAPEIIPTDDILNPSGVCVAHPGADVSVVCYGMMGQMVLQAARQMEEEGISVEVLDLRILHPLEIEPVLESVRKTGKVLIVQEDHLSGGYGAEVAARIAEQAFTWLDAPVRRLGAPEVPGVPFSPRLQDWYMLDVEKISSAIRALAEF